MAPKSKKCVVKGGGPGRYSDRLAAGAPIRIPETHLATFSDEALPKGGAIGLAGGARRTGSSRFPSLGPVPVFSADKPAGSTRRVADGHHLTLRELTTDAVLTDEDRVELPKPQFLFGDSATDPSALLIKESRWLRVMDGVHYYLPNMPRGFSIVELRSLAVPRTMN